MSNLTPYDTGARLEPKPWNVRPEPGIAQADIDPDAYGRVDFDNDEGATVLTAYMEPDGNGGYTLHLDADEAAVTVAFNGAPVGWISTPELPENAAYPENERRKATEGDVADDRECTDAEMFRHDAEDMRNCASVEVSWVAKDAQGRDVFVSDMTITAARAAAMFEGIAATCEPATAKTIEQIAIGRFVSNTEVEGGFGEIETIEEVNEQASQGRADRRMPLRD